MLGNLLKAPSPIDEILQIRAPSISLWLLVHHLLPSPVGCRCVRGFHGCYGSYAFYGVHGFYVKRSQLDLSGQATVSPFPLRWTGWNSTMAP